MMSAPRPHSTMRSSGHSNPRRAQLWCERGGARSLDRERRRVGPRRVRVHGGVAGGRSPVFAVGEPPEEQIACSRPPVGIPEAPLTLPSG